MLLFNDITWNVSILGEQVLLLETSKDIPIEKIHASTFMIEGALESKLKDIVPAYCSIAVFTDLAVEDFLKAIQKSIPVEESAGNQKEVVELPICYELGVDLDRVAAQNKLKVDQVIETHLKGTYRSLFIGFTPGFIYADGLDPSLACPRLENPRRRIPEGSVGIAGNQTGIYSLASPGGWNIIGRTPEFIFNPKESTPMKVEVGTRYQFFRITKAEFVSWGS